jgi:hypothetical protein
MKYVPASIICPNCESREIRKVPKEIRKGKKKTFIFCQCNVMFEVYDWQFKKDK